VQFLGVKRLIVIGLQRGKTMVTSSSARKKSNTKPTPKPPTKTPGEWGSKKNPQTKEGYPIEWVSEGRNYQKRVKGVGPNREEGGPEVKTGNP